ncbi:MAG: hypothetical protein OXN85_01645 [Gemmatimonadetes bacterium]|nr:hypothetical protein [Candidatus Palauibacter australiensis]
MRVLFTVITLVLVSVAPLAGQATLAVKGGLGRALLGTDEAGVVTSPRTGVVAGAELGFALTPSLGLRFGGSFAQKGSNSVRDRRRVVVGARLDYLQVSALIRLRTPIQSQGVAVSLLAGPWAGHLLSCSASAEAPDEGELNAICLREGEGSVGTPVVVATAVKSMDYGIAAGVALEVGIGGLPKLAADLIWAPGLGEIDIDGRKTKHIFVQAGIMLPLGSRAESPSGG